MKYMSNRELVLVISIVLLLALAGLCLTGLGIHRKKECCGDFRPLSAESVGADSLFRSGTECGPAGAAGVAGAAEADGTVGAAGPAEAVKAAGADGAAGPAGIIEPAEAAGVAEVPGAVGAEPSQRSRDSLAAEPHAAGRRKEAVRMLPGTE